MVGEFVGKAGVKAELFWLHRDDEVVPEFLVVGNDDSAAAHGKGIWKAGIRDGTGVTRLLRLIARNKSTSF